jgi:hypothetical protein
MAFDHHSECAAVDTEGSYHRQSGFPDSFYIRLLGGIHSRLDSKGENSGHPIHDTSSCMYPCLDRDATNAVLPGREGRIVEAETKSDSESCQNSTKSHLLTKGFGF